MLFISQNRIMTRPKKNTVQNTDSPFKKLRLFVKKTQEQLAKEIGVAVSTIRRWEKGQAEPTFTVQQMLDFCESIDTNFYDLPKSLLPVDKQNQNHDNDVKAA